MENHNENSKPVDPERKANIKDLIRTPNMRMKTIIICFSWYATEQKRVDFRLPKEKKEEPIFFSFLSIYPQGRQRDGICRSNLLRSINGIRSVLEFLFVFRRGDPWLRRMPILDGTMGKTTSSLLVHDVCHLYFFFL